MTAEPLGMGTECRSVHVWGDTREGASPLCRLALVTPGL